MESYPSANPGMSRQESAQPRLLVMGAGAIGSVIGGLLAEKGHDVWFCGRHAHIDAIRQSRLKINGIWGEHHITVQGLVTSLSELPAGLKFDLILLTVKSFDTAAAVELVLPFTKPDSLIISMQNGLGNAEAIAAIAGRERTIAARVIFGAQINSPGEVEVTVYAEEVMLGSPFDCEQHNKRLDQLARMMTEAGIPTQRTSHIEQYLWAKLLYNACLNPMCSLLRCQYGRLLEQDGTCRLMNEIIREIYTIAAKRRVRLAHPTPDEYQQVLFNRLIPATYDHYPSMLQDINRGRRTEIDAINGIVVRYGRESALPTPVNAMLTDLIKALENQTGSK